MSKQTSYSTIPKLDCLRQNSNFLSGLDGFAGHVHLNQINS